MSDEQRLMLDSVDRLMEKYDEAYWGRLEANRSYPDEFVKAMEGQGLAAVPVSKEYGGPGLGVLDASLILEEINAMGGNSQPFHGQYYLLFALSRFASASMKEKYLPKIASGELRLQSLALTEPEAGSETTRIKTSAERRGDSYVVKGHKVFISRVENSDLMVLVARTTPYEKAEKKTDGISLFLVPLDKVEGIESHRVEMMFNSQTYELFIDELKVPVESLIGEEGKGFRYLLSILNPERILLSAECIGDSRWFVEKSVEYAKQRVVFGRPIGSNQGVQFPIAEVYAKLLAADRVRTTAAELFDSGGDDKAVGEYANASKYLASECSWQAANVAMDVYGGSGLAVGNHIERKFRETRLFRVAPISNNLVLSYLGEHVLGLPRSF
ncbi:MAG: acyl-CoA/acyl-ACP dehydrogenase [Nitrososphaerota archaeon]|nr:acyl-CoA/acyl-ACP dehydrogenase [Nitrososphaerota archaeon]